MLTIMAVLIVSTATVHAQTNHYPDPVYLSKTEIVVNQALPPPPMRNSERDKSDFERILSLQESRTPAECDRATFVVDVALKTLFGAPYGPLSAPEVQKWEAFFEKVRIDTDYFVQEAKKQWGRPRPYFVDERVHPCVKREVTNAYPSGHAAIARVFSKVLRNIFPDRGSLFTALAEQIGQDRVLAGVHHPTDIEAGNLLGDVAFDHLMNNPRFIEELEAMLHSSSVSYQQRTQYFAWESL